MPNKKRIIVVGSSNTDMVIRCEKMPRPGETVLGGEFMMNQGGKGANQAVAAARLGGDVTLVAKLGDDLFGINTIEELKGYGVNTDKVNITSTTPSGVALINVDASGENSISVASGANALLNRADIDAATDRIAEAGIMLLQLESPIDTIIHAARVAKAHGVMVVLNPAPAPAHPLPDELLRNVDIVIPNKTEAEIISGVKIENEDSERQAIEAIASKGIAITIITLGSKGALLCIDGECVEVESRKVEVVDTTAAGDTFCGALCVGLTEGMPLSEAVKFANCAASISVTRKGAQQSVPARAEVDAAMLSVN